MGILPIPALAALTFNPGATTAQMSSILDGPGLTVSNLRVSRGVSGQVGILNGPGGDSSVILGSTLVVPENTQVNANYQLRGYYATDLNMDGYVVFSDPGNEINLLMGTVLLSPDNASGSANYIVHGTLPR